jgi:hypothetical protein
MTARRGMDAVAWAAAQHRDPSKNWYMLCLQFVRMALNVAAVHPSAEKAFYATTRRRGTQSTPPAGVPVWWTNGGYGHVALSAGGGYVWSNDILRRGKIDKVSIDYITRNWGQRYRGWTEDINGVRVYTPPPLPAAPAVGDWEAPKDRAGHKVMSYSALREAGSNRRLSGWYAQYRHQAMGSLMALGIIPRGTPDTQFPEAWEKFERKIRRRTPNKIPDYYSFMYFTARCGYREPDNGPASGAPRVRPDWPEEP